MAEVANLNSDTNFSRSSGIIYQIEDGSALEGRPKSKVYVFTKVGKNLKYILDEGNKISFMKSISDKLSKANILSKTLKTKAVSLKGKLSVTPFLFKQYSLTSSIFIGNS